MNSSREYFPRVHTLVVTGLLVFAFSAQWAEAFEEPKKTAISQAEFSLSELQIETAFRLPRELPDQAASKADADLAVLGLDSDSGRIDVRGAGWATLILSEPLVPGTGAGNRLKWSSLGHGAPGDVAEFKSVVFGAFRDYVDAASRELRIDPAELSSDETVTVFDNQSTVQIYIPRVYQGVKVRGSYLTATIKHGNLTLLGTQHWGRINTSVVPGIDASEAIDTVRLHVDGYELTGEWRSPELMLVPFIRGTNPNASEFGNGYGYRLAWVVSPSFQGDSGRFEALVDARSGELMSFQDTNQYASQREVVGGVFPVSNDGVSPDGVEQPNWPMPFDRVVTPTGTVVTDSGGNLPVPVDGNITSTLAGEYVTINDNCGAISLTSSGDLDFGSSGGTDCATPGYGGAGNTHSARTGFHELNRIIEMGRGQLPANNWLKQNLTANMNINNICNAYWNGTVNFYRSGGGCQNTGELAGVFDHEWGHGMDANDAIPGISRPSGEGIADIYAALRLNSSCIGRNFRTTPCTGNGDACTVCTGVRDIDYLKRTSGLPHDYTWSNANCGGSVHCMGAVYAEAVWSLWKRELQSAPYSYDDHTAHEIVTRMTYIGAGNTGTWFSGGPPNGGCAANSGYMNFLAADDDNGDLTDGTPHMTAIYNAFNDQEIACATPVVQDSGCAGVATTAPVLAATGQDKAVGLSWDAVSGASSYEVFRTDGVFGCDFGKVRVGETVENSFTDTGLQSGRDYSYIVIPKGASAACFGPASNCATVAPVAGPNIYVDPASAVLLTSGGDADQFIDNCEMGTLTFEVVNNGVGGLTNARVTGVTVVSPVGTTIVSVFPLAISPAALAEGATGTASFDFDAHGLTTGGSVVFEVSVTADEIFPADKTQTFILNDAENDLLSMSSKTWSFESDLEGWTVVEGTFNQTTTGGGASGSSGYVASSSLLDNQCDQIRSPTIQLTSTSMLTLENNYEIEGEYSPGEWYDRANVGITEGGQRGAVDPDGGRLYNATGAGASCATTGQNGWAEANNTWGSSSWSATALDSANYAGALVQIDIAYGTDFALNGKGFWFDEVTVTDIELLTPDVQSDSCGVPVNNPPAVTITAPADGTSFTAGDSINFTGSASDTEDGDISANIGWSSSVDGAIGSGSSVDTTTLGAGEHTITAEVTDSGAPTASPKSGSDQITITINAVPSVSITSPADGSSAVEGDAVTFTGTASDDEDGDISSIIEWSSDLDGAIGTGSSLETSGLSDGTHAITAQVTDSGGASSEDQISFTVTIPEPDDVYVAGIVTGTEPAQQGMKYGTASVTVHDSNGQPVGAGYTVTGNFSGSYADTNVSAVTFSDGVALLQTSSTAKKGVEVGFCVSDVSGALLYAPEQNTDPSFACASLGDVHVENIQTGSQSLGGGSKAGTASVTIYGDNGLPQAGYSVFGNFDGDFVESAGPAVTGSDGTATFQTSGNKKGKLAFSFCVDNVSGTKAYDSTDNADSAYACNP